jgi:hypothetical protein
MPCIGCEDEALNFLERIKAPNMNVKEAVKFILEQIETETDSVSRSNDGLNCPDEVEILAYCEGRISDRNRAEIYKHISTCYNCIELLAMFAQISEQESDDEIADLENAELKMPNPEDRKLAKKVLEMIEKDELKFIESR